MKPRDTYSGVPLMAAALVGCMVSLTAQASSHREAPFISQNPKVDGTDFYMFRSYEDGRDGFVTLIANYQPLQDAYGGPNYYPLNENARYEIHVDNNGDAVSDITFRFDIDNDFQNIAVPTTPDGGAPQNTVPVLTTQPGGVGPGVTQTDGLNLIESYQVDVLRGDGNNGQSATNRGNSSGQGAGSDTFRKPVDNIGSKSINDYQTYAQNHIYGIQIPGCSADGGDGAGVGRVFVGQRREGFYINLGEVFDLINIPAGELLGGRTAGQNIINDKNITSLAMEVPVGCLTADGDQDGTTGDPVIGAWTTASLPQVQVLDPTPGAAPGGDGDNGQTDSNAAVQGGAFTQVSRNGSPLVNEVVIGLPQKNRFNASQPVDDLDQFATFVTNPTLPVLANALFPSVAIPATPRNDLVQAFVTGVPGLTQPQAIADGNGRGGEMLRLNTSIAPAGPNANGFSDLGFLGCDLAGFPNGRRPVDDVTDIELSVAEGAIADANPNELQTCDLSGDSPQVVNDGNVVADGVALSNDGGDLFVNQFPYLNTPLPGSPAEESEPDSSQ